MLEAVWPRTHELVEAGRTAGASSVLLSPGIRGAIHFPSGLQMVPGIAMPIGVGQSRGERRVFVYLSLGHGVIGGDP